MGTDSITGMGYGNGVFTLTDESKWPNLNERTATPAPEPPKIRGILSIPIYIGHLPSLEAEEYVDRMREKNKEVAARLSAGGVEVVYAATTDPESIVPDYIKF